MTRRILASVLVAAIAITSFNATAVQAGDRDVAKIIVGATALAIIGSALAAEQRKQNQVSRHQPSYQPQYPRYQNQRHNRYDNHRPKQQYRPVVSRECLMSVRGQRGWTEGYAVRCAQRTTRATLPSDCVRRNYAQGPRLFYAPVCLRRNGFNA